MKTAKGKPHYECIDTYYDHDPIVCTTSCMFRGFNRIETFNFFKEELINYGNVIIPKKQRQTLVVIIPDDYLMYIGGERVIWERLLTRAPYPFKFEHME